jgi:hypothetical protein
MEPSGAELDQPGHERPAREQGHEGVACVDDAARAVVLYCALWQQRHDPAARAAAAGLLRFLAYMQEADGRFANFIFDWTGQRNRTGLTSYPGGPAWQARAVHALACGVATFGDSEWEERFQRGVRWLDDSIPYLDVRAVAVLAALQHWRATRSADSADRIVVWAEAIAGQSQDGILLDAAGVAPPHLWGHLQEAALAAAGHALARPDLVACAQASADALLVPAVDKRLPVDSLLPFDVSCVAAGLTGVANATGCQQYADAAARARAWFSGRNAARAPVYDRERGLVYDGVDEGRVSRNSGAESNVEGGLALCVA